MIEVNIIREALINSTNVMKGEAHGTQQPRHINLIGEGVSTAQRSNSLVQSINQRFPRSFVDFGKLFCRRRNDGYYTESHDRTLL